MSPRSVQYVDNMAKLCKSIKNILSTCRMVRGEEVPIFAGGVYNKRLARIVDFDWFTKEGHQTYVDSGGRSGWAQKSDASLADSVEGLPRMLDLIETIDADLAAGDRADHWWTRAMTHVKELRDLLAADRANGVGLGACVDVDLNFQSLSSLLKRLEKR
jgi:hypothetical protein